VFDMTGEPSHKIDGEFLAACNSQSD